MQSASGQGEWFSSTHWSVVAQAAASDLPGSRDALEALCRVYWHPLFLFALRSGRSPDDARELTQGFFEQLIAKSALATADPQRGKFRSFLLASFKHFLAHQHTKATTQKRGGAISFVPLEIDPDHPDFIDPPENRTPDFVFDQRWAISLFEEVLGRLRAEFRLAGQEPIFDAFKQYLAGDSTEPYAAVAARIGMTKGAAKMFVSRLRARYRHLLRAEIARTVSTPAEIDEEIRYLRQIFSPE